MLKLEHPIVLDKAAMQSPNLCESLDPEDLQRIGVFGVYTTAEALKNRDVVKLTGFSIGSLNTKIKLGE